MSGHELIQTGESAGYMILKERGSDFMASDELAGLDIALERIRIPSAASTVFEVPGEDPSEPETVKEFSGVILYHHPLHTYYMEEYTGGNSPPDCGSRDGITGQGDPGGSCDNCPNSLFGSGKNGGKACKDRRHLYILREGEAFPLLFAIPPTSLKDFGRYITRLLSKGKTSNSVVTRFSLQKAANQGGITYSQVRCVRDRDLSPEECELVKALGEQVKRYSQNLDYEIVVASDNPYDAPNVDPETGEVI